MPTNATEHQRELIRTFNDRFEGDEDAICAAYAKAESDGLAFRKGGDFRLDSREYARRLLELGRSHGWLYRSR